MDVQSGEDLVVVRPVRDVTRDVTGFSEHVLLGCVVAPTTSSEDLGGGDRVTDDYTVYVLAGADVLSEDRIRRPSDPTPTGDSGLGVRAPWQVHGTPAPWRSPFSGWTPGTVLRIRRARG